MEKTIARPAPQGRSADKEWTEWARQVTDHLDGVSVVDRKLTTTGDSAPTQIWTAKVPADTVWHVEAWVDGVVGSDYAHWVIRAKVVRGAGAPTLSAVMMVEEDITAAFAIAYSVTDDSVVLTVTDAGAGLDWKARVTVNEARG